MDDGLLSKRQISLLHVAEIIQWKSCGRKSSVVTNSRAFHGPHRKQDIWLRKRQCNLNVIIYRTNERVKLTGESCTWHTFKLRLYGGRLLYIVDPFVHAKSWQQRSCIRWFSRLYLIDSARQPKVYGEKMTRLGGWPCHRNRVTQIGGSPLLPNQLFLGLLLNLGTFGSARVAWVGEWPFLPEKRFLYTNRALKTHHHIYKLVREARSCWQERFV